jgi:hypothetical protein
MPIPAQSPDPRGFLLGLVQAPGMAPAQRGQRRAGHGVHSTSLHSVHHQTAVPFSLLFARQENAHVEVEDRPILVFPASSWALSSPSRDGDENSRALFNRAVYAEDAATDWSPSTVARWHGEHN